MALLLGGCSELVQPGIPEPCNPDVITERSAGEGSVACGRAPRGLDAGMVHACTVAAWDAGVTFHARFDLGTDDAGRDYRRYLVLDGRARLLFYSFDGDPAGPGGTGSTLVYAPCLHAWVEHSPGEPARIECSLFGPNTVACAEKSEPQE